MWVNGILDPWFWGSLYYKDEDEIHNSDQRPGAASSVPWVLSNILPFGRPPNLRGLLSYDSGDKGQHHRKIGLSRKNSVDVKSRRKKYPEVVRLLNVTETIFYATLNHTSPQVIALFTHTLVQKCVQKTPFQPYHCHPHYNTMPNSSTYYFNCKNTITLYFEPSFHSNIPLLVGQTVRRWGWSFCALLNSLIKIQCLRVRVQGMYDKG